MASFKDNMEKFRLFKKQLNDIDPEWIVLRLKFSIDVKNLDIYVRANLEKNDKQYKLNFNDSPNNDDVGWVGVTSSEVNHNFRLYMGLDSLFDFMIQYYRQECAIRDSTVFNCVMQHDSYSISYDPKECNNDVMYPFVIYYTGAANDIDINSFKTLPKYKSLLLKALNKLYEENALADTICIDVDIFNVKEKDTPQISKSFWYTVGDLRNTLNTAAMSDERDDRLYEFLNKLENLYIDESLIPTTVIQCVYTLTNNDTLMLQFSINDNDNPSHKGFIYGSEKSMGVLIDIETLIKNGIFHNE